MGEDRGEAGVIVSVGISGEPSTHCDGNSVGVDGEEGDFDALVVISRSQSSILKSSVVCWS